MTPIRLFCGASILLCTLSACTGDKSSDGASPETKIASVSVVGGDGQTAPVGTELPDSVLAQVLDHDDQPVPGQLVHFVVTAGGGTISSDTATSDSNGYVSTRWTLGTGAGAQSVAIQAPDASGAVVTYATFRAVACAGPPQTIDILSGNLQTGVQLQPLPLPVKVVVKDGYGNGAPGISVTFTANDGNVSPASATTDAAGEAQATWTMGTANAETLTAAVTGLPGVSFTATAMLDPATPTTTTKVSGDQQTVTQHFWLRQPLVVSVTDTLGRPVAGYQVQFNAAPGSGYFTPRTVATDANGHASWSGSFHVTGEQSIEVTPVGLESVSFTTTVTPSSHTYDGVYECNYFRMGIAYGQLLLPGLLPGIPVPVAPPPPIPTDYDVSGTLDESNGYFLGTKRRSLDSYLTFSGYLTVDSIGRGSGAGTTVATVLGSTIFYVDFPDWSCVRQ